METGSFNGLVEQFLGAPLPRELAEKISFPDLSSEARDIVLRMLALMKRASTPVTEFNPHMIRLLSVVTPGMLPSAWGGRIPPVTSPNRHKKFDAYVERLSFPSTHGRPVFMDLGCGFPPVTTTETAERLTTWSVFGVDRSFARYLLYDADGQYACFDGAGEFEYFQPLTKPLHENPRAARDRFKRLFAELSPLLGASEHPARAAVEKDGCRLIFNPIRNFEADNLTFIESDIEALELHPARVLRCMNVLLYFEKKDRGRLREKMGALLEDGGILISGFNHPFGIYARYGIYRKEADGMSPVEFSFSADNLRPLGVGPWVTIRDMDEETELLADLTGALRADRTFWPEFDRCIDVLREEHGICRRGADGFIRFTDEVKSASSDVLMKKTAALWQQVQAQGFVDGAVEALGRAGYDAWKNAVGDIAVLPPPSRLFSGIQRRGNGSPSI